MQILLGGQDITSYSEGKRSHEVIVRAQNQFCKDPDSIGDFYVRASQGQASEDQNQLVPLSSVVDVNLSTTPPQINHFSRSRSATIQASTTPGASLGDSLNALENLTDEVIPQEFNTAWSGQSLQFRQAGQAILLIFTLAVVFIFLVLAAQFESYIDHIIILLAVPLSLLGALGALLLVGLELNIYSQIGLIMLIGLVSKNSILIVELANQQRDRGRSTTQAALDAGRVRFRPILMTAFSTIFGLMPLALASGAGAASRVSLGTAVVGGMLVSTLFKSVCSSRFLRHCRQSANSLSIEI